ncbi:MAG TPA: aldo/keto reductase [Jatrophihabitans sp.]|nr:aldo/keto reductase [Jatrophihabitans sp.]
MTDTLNQASGTFEIAGRTVHRLGFGAMRLTGPGIWGEPADRDECIRVLRRAVDLGVDLIDTADSYGPYVSEELIREALHPYPENLLIATKAGFVRHGPDLWFAVGRPEYLKQEVIMSLRRLGLERIDLFQLHRIDSKVPLEEQIGVLTELQDEGKIASIGLSEVSVNDIEQVRKLAEVTSVQNLYNLTNRRSEDVLDYCTREGMAFIPWYPIAAGKLAEPGGIVDEIAKRHDATAAQVALAWLLARAQVMLPIPGTSKVSHLEENMGAAQLYQRLSREEVDQLTAAAS